MRGVFLGAVSGLALSAVVLGTLSLVAPQPAGNRPPEAPATEAPAPAAVIPPDDGATTGPTPEADPAAPEAGMPGLALPEDGGAPEADTLPPATPEIGAGAAPLAEPEPPSPVAAPEAATAADRPVTLAPQGPAPQQPALESPPEAEAAMTPANPPVAEAPAMDSPAGGDATPQALPAGDDVTPAPAPSPLAGTDSADAVAPDADATAPPEAALDLAALAAPDEGAAPALGSPATAGAPAGAAAPLAPAAPEDDAPDVAPDGPAPDAPRTPSIALQGDGTPRLPGGDNGVVIRRPGADDAAAPDLPGSADTTLPPVWQAAAAFDNPGTLPVVALVLLDDGTLADAPQVAAALPFPVTVALDPLAADAAMRADAYRAAGVETAALARFPEGATATDAVVGLGATFATLPGAVALVDAGDGGTDAARDLAEAALAWLGTAGRGLAWLPEGGDPIARLAVGADAPARAILRDLDGAGQDSGAIRRFLDNAPMRARQDGAVILLAHLRPETLNALMLWAATARAETVTLAPLSVALTEGRSPPVD